MTNGTAFTAEVEVAAHCTAFLQLGSVLDVLYVSMHVPRSCAWHDVRRRLSLDCKMLPSMYMHSARVLDGCASDARPGMTDSRQVLCIAADLCVFVELERAQCCSSASTGCSEEGSGNSEGSFKSC